MLQLTNGMKLGEAEVVVDIIPKGNPEIRPGRIITPTFVTYHNTGNPGRGADAKMHNRYIHNLASYHPKDTSHISWHLTVDDKFIYQHIPFNENAWHCGDGSGVRSGNLTSIGIEICMHVDQENYHQAEENAIALGIYLSKHLNIPISNHTTHQRWSGKFCPAVILRRDGGFTKFHDRIKLAEKVEAVAIAAPAQTTPAAPVRVPAPTGKVIGTAEVLVPSLNIRSEDSFTAPIVDMATKGQKFDVYETKNGLHRVKAGWLSAGAKFSHFTAVGQAVAAPSLGSVIGTAEVITHTLNIRRDANFSSPVVGTARSAQKFDVYETKNGLHRVEAGWLSAGSKFTRFTKKAAPVAAEKIIGSLEVVTHMLNIRSAASFNSGVVGTAQLGQKFSVYETKGGLHRIGKNRWVSAQSKFVKFTQAGGNTPSQKGDMKTTSLVDYLRSIGQDAGFSNRKKLAASKGMKNYTGTASQNTTLLRKLRGA